jgi:predicted HTH transcriptional regulator|tara:strand:+ start:327 stop:536 length:210 start_codon:yes stop_codon:yes gene_type:complete
MKNKPIRIVKEPKVLAKKVIEYFYKNPEANTSKEMEQVFNVSHRRIRKIISEHLKDKLENSFARRMARL